MFVLNGDKHAIETLIAYVHPNICKHVSAEIATWHAILHGIKTFPGVDIRISSALAGGGGEAWFYCSLPPPQVLNLPKGQVGFYSSLPESKYCVNSV